MYENDFIGFLLTNTCRCKNEISTLLDFLNCCHCRDSGVEMEGSVESVAILGMDCVKTRLVDGMQRE